MEKTQCKGELKGLRGRIKKEPKKTLSSQHYAGRAAGLAILARHRAWEGRVKLVRRYLKRQHPKPVKDRLYCGNCCSVLSLRDVVLRVMNLTQGCCANRSSSICSSI